MDCCIGVTYHAQQVFDAGDMFFIALLERDGGNGTSSKSEEGEDGEEKEEKGEQIQEREEGSLRKVVVRTDCCCEDEEEEHCQDDQIFLVDREFTTGVLLV